MRNSGANAGDWEIEQQEAKTIGRWIGCDWEIDLWGRRKGLVLNMKNKKNGSLVIRGRTSSIGFSEDGAEEIGRSMDN